MARALGEIRTGSQGVPRGPRRRIVLLPLVVLVILSLACGVLIGVVLARPETVFDVVSWEDEGEEECEEGWDVEAEEEDEDGPGGTGICPEAEAFRRELEGRKGGMR